MNKKLAYQWCIRFIKYNLIGITVWLITTILFLFLFPHYGMWSWFIVAPTGAIIDFTLISYFNRKRKSMMFESCKEH